MIRGAQVVLTQPRKARVVHGWIHVNEREGGQVTFEFTPKRDKDKRDMIRMIFSTDEIKVKNTMWVVRKDSQVYVCCRYSHKEGTLDGTLWSR